jgi:hypothetical protein
MSDDEIVDAIETGDSNDWPCGPFAEGGGESDNPQHCGSGAYCVNAIKVSCTDGIGKNKKRLRYKIGCWLENPLTQEGIEYVREAAAEEPYSAVAGRLWRKWYAKELK